MPATPGTTYEFRLFANDGTTRLATSGPVVVSATVTSLNVSPTTVPGGSTFTVNWTGVNPASADDWIGLFPAGSPNSGFPDWKYVSCTRNPGAVRASGSCDFTAPTTAGPFEIRMFEHDTFVQIGDTVPLTVTPPPASTLTGTPSPINPGATITVSWSGIASPSARDRIGLFCS
jgi:hypothetical protein